MNGKPRDGQRAKAYRAEDAAFNRDKCEGLSVERCQALIDRWSQSKVLQRHYPRATVPLQVRDGRGHRRAVYYHNYLTHDYGYMGPVIHLPKWARSKWVLLHEWAHHLTYDDGAGHGWEWAKCYLYLVRVFIGPWAEDKLKVAFKANKVRYKAPQTRRLTDAQRDAAKQRMLDYHAERAAV